MPLVSSYRNLDKKSEFLGLEGLDVIFVFLVFFVCNYIQQKVPEMSGFVTFLCTGATWLFFAFFKKGKPKGYFSSIASDYLGKDILLAYHLHKNHKKPQNLISKIQTPDWASYIPYRDICNSFLYQEGGVVTFFVDVLPVSLDSMTISSRQELWRKLHELLINCQELEDYGFYYYVSNDFSKELDEFKEEISDIPVIRKIRTQQIEEVEEMIQKQDVYKTRIILECSFKSKFKISSFSAFGSAERMETDRHIASTEDQGEILYNKLSMGLKSANIDHRRLANNEIFSLLYESINPIRFHARGGKVRYKRWLELLPQLCFSDVQKEKAESMFYMGDIHEHAEGYYHSVISMRVLPEMLETGDIMKITRNHTNKFSVKMNIGIPNKTEEIKRLKAQRRRQKNNMRTMKNEINDEAAIAYQETDELLYALNTRNEKVYRVELIVRVWHEHKDELKKSLVAIKNCFASMQAEYYEEKADLLEIWGSGLPGISGVKKRQIGTHGQFLANLLPVFGEFNGSSRARCLFKTPNKALIAYDFYDPKLNAWNGFCCAGTGAGKSVLMNKLLCEFKNYQNTKVIVLDIGNSYKKVCHLAGGQYIQWGAKDIPIINPFDLKGADNVARKISSVKYLLARMYKGQVALSAIEDTLLDLALTYSFQKNKQKDGSYKSFLMEDFSKYLQEKSFEEYIRKSSDSFEVAAKPLKEMRFVFSKYILGPKSKYINGHTNVNFDKDFIVFELKELTDDPELLNIQFFNIMQAIWAIGSEKREEKVVLVFDEAWKFFLDEQGASFAEEIWNTARKYNMAAFCVFQRISVLLEAKCGKAILANSYNQWYLQQNSLEEIASAKNILQLNEQEIEQISLVHTEKGCYADVFVKQKSGNIYNKGVSGIIRNQLSRMEYWVYTSDSEDNDLIEIYEHVYPNKNYLQIIEQIIEDEQKWVQKQGQMSQAEIVKRLKADVIEKISIKQIPQKQAYTHHQKNERRQLAEV